jgi:hypothetical protein
MAPAANYVDRVAYDPINQTMLLDDAAAPEAAQMVLQRFWLADASKRISHDIFQEAVDALQNLSVFFLPR